MYRALLTSLVLLGATAGLAGQPRQAAPPLPPNPTPEEVRQEWGAPPRVARQIVARRYLEQWVYDAPPRRIAFSHVHGEKPQFLPVAEAP